MTQTNIADSGAESVVSITVSSGGTRIITKTRKPYGTTNYLFEAFCYTETRKLGAHVPSVVEVTENKLTMTALNGETLDDKLELFDNDSIFQAIAKDLALNRDITFKGFGRATKDGKTYRGEDVSWVEFLSDTQNKIKKSTILNDKQKTMLNSSWQLLKKQVSINSGALVHGDFAISAVFVNNGKYEGIIDFGDAFVGDPLMDLAYFRFKELTKPYGFKLYNALAGHYASYANISRSYIDIAVLFYMIYWSVERVHAHNIDDDLIAKFLDKTNVLIDLLTEEL